MYAIFSKRFTLILLLGFFLAGCVNTPPGVKPVSNFDKQRYLGKWYEIARLDHSFERGLQQVTAQYSMRDDGGIAVLNKGFKVAEGAWEEAQGKAYFVDEESTGHLKVSFFGPFYASYVIAALDHEDYQYALVTGPNTDYLWILSREPSLDSAILQKLKSLASDWGFDVESLIFVQHISDEQIKQ